MRRGVLVGAGVSELHSGNWPSPTVAEPSAFVLDIGPDRLRATAATFDRVRDGQILAALVPEAVRMTATNNRLGWLHANPWH